MTSDISIGTTTQQAGRTIVTGTSSGIDTASLIENAVQANNDSADLIDIQIDENQTKIASYEEFYGLAYDLQESLSYLQSISSRSGIEESVFDQRTGSLTSDGADVTGLVSASIDDAAAEGSYEIVVTQKAEAFSVGSTIVTDNEAALGDSGTFEISLDGYTPTVITVGADTTLQDIADAVNADSDTSGVEASILKVSETEYQLILSGSEENQAMNISTTSGSVLQNLGLVDASDDFVSAQIIQAAQGSSITLDGTVITRDDNSYDDLISGVSFDILADDVGTTMTLTIENDTSGVKDAIVTFIDSYNSYREFVLDNQEVGADGTVSDDAVLFSDSLLENLTNTVSGLLSGFGNDTSGLSGLREIGITFDDNNLLVLDDETALDDAILNNFESIEGFFATHVDIDNSQLGLISNSSIQESLEFTLDITTDANGDIVTASANGVANAFEIDGSSLIGRSGTVYEGLTFAYVGSADATISVSMEAGLADLLVNNIEGYTDSSTGLIQTEINLLQDANEDYGVEAEEIRERGEEIREQEITKYTNMETELSRLQSLLDTISALLGNDE